MTAPSIKEALELLPCPFCGGEAAIVEGDECAYVQCLDMKMHRALWFKGDNNAANEVAEQWNTRAALATLQPSGEMREAIARHNQELALGFCKASFQKRFSLSDSRTKEYAACIADVLDLATDFASGLVQDEAGIRADEREKCAKIADLFVNHDAEYGAKYPDEAFKFDNRWLRSKTIADAIRSARDGGE